MTREPGTASTAVAGRYRLPHSRHKCPLAPGVMKSTLLASAAAPRPIESAHLLRAPARASSPMLTVASLSRVLGVVALSACAVLAFALTRGVDPAPEPAKSSPSKSPPSKSPPSRSAPARPTPSTAAPAAATIPQPASQPTSAAPASDVRLVYGNPDAMRPPERPGPPAEPMPASTPAPAVTPATAPVPTLAPAPAPVVAAMPEASLEPGGDDAGKPIPASSGGVDLNAASLEQLNGLNAGMIGRAIVRGRPYAAPSELLDRRILTRSDYEKIRGRVTVSR